VALLGIGAGRVANWVSERRQERNPRLNDGALVSDGSQVAMDSAEIDSRAEAFLAEREQAREEAAQALRDDEDEEFGEDDELFFPEEYLVRGADLFCTYGSHTRKLNLPKCHGVYITDAPVIHKLDCIPGDAHNIASFGVCDSPAIRDVRPKPPRVLLEKTIYNEDGEPVGTQNIRGRACTPQIASTWLQTYDETRIVDNGTHNPSDKLKDNEDSTKGYPAVTTESFLICACGGIIQPFTSGQNRETVIHESTGEDPEVAIRDSLAGLPNILDHDDEEKDKKDKKSKEEKKDGTNNFLDGVVRGAATNPFMFNLISFFSNGGAGRGARIRHEENSSLFADEAEGFIHGQRLAPQSDLSLGSRGTGSANGCGPIAIHNAIFAVRGEQNPINIADVALALEVRSGFISGGSLGTNPESAVRVIRDAGHRAEITYNPTNLDDIIRNAETTIILYDGGVTTGYVHYIMVRYVDGQFSMYNVGGRDTRPNSQTSVDEWFATVQTNSGNNRTPWAIIEVSYE